MQCNIIKPYKEQINTICGNMDEPRHFHTEWSKSEKDRYSMISLICGIKKKYKLTYIQKNK